MQNHKAVNLYCVSKNTDQERLVEGAVDVIYNTMRMTGLQHDEGPDIGGDMALMCKVNVWECTWGMPKNWWEKGQAYYCFCTKERLESFKRKQCRRGAFGKYIDTVSGLSEEEVQAKLDAG